MLARRLYGASLGRLAQARLRPGLVQATQRSIRWESSYPSTSSQSPSSSLDFDNLLQKPRRSSTSNRTNTFTRSSEPYVKSSGGKEAVTEALRQENEVDETGDGEDLQPDLQALASEDRQPAKTPLTAREKTEMAGHPPDSFNSLKGYVSYDIFKALTDRPFRFTTMSVVQEKVFGLLPELSEASARGAQPDPVAEDVDTEKRGNRSIATDLLIKAKTGTGKTLAFLVPAVQGRLQDIKQAEKEYLLQNPTADKNSKSRYIANLVKTSVGTVILSPTRELATQIATEATRLTSHIDGFKTHLWIGGASRMMQLREFSRFNNRKDIIVATPGRLNDMLSEPAVAAAVTQAKTLVFDEADTLLDMGFSKEIDEIVSRLPPKESRQTFMFSATVSKDIQQIARKYLKREHTFVDCVPLNETNTHDKVPQFATVVDTADEQIPHVLRLLSRDALLHPDGGKAIVFCPTTKMTQMVTQMLAGMRSELPWGTATKVFEIHAQKNQSGRDHTSARFRGISGPGYSILVTTDVSARGVDYPGVTQVIQLGIPTAKDMYVHRVGRTGRAGKDGRADLVLSPWERKYITNILPEMPITILSPTVLQEELEALASEADSKPQENARPRDYRSRPSLQGAGPLLPRMQNLAEHLKTRVLPMLSEEETSMLFGAQVGFYVGHGMEVGLSKMSVYNNLQENMRDMFAMPTTPTLSRSLLTRIGVSDNAQKGFGSRGGDRGGYGGFSRSGGDSRPRNGRSDTREGGGYQSRRPSFDRDSERGWGSSDFSRGERSGDSYRPRFGSSDGGRTPFRSTLPRSPNRDFTRGGGRKPSYSPSSLDDF